MAFANPHRAGEVSDLIQRLQLFDEPEGFRREHFSTSFTPSIKKVIDFLKSFFDVSIPELENKIKFWLF